MGRSAPAGNTVKNVLPRLIDGGHVQHHRADARRWNSTAAGHGEVHRRVRPERTATLRLAVDGRQAGPGLQQPCRVQRRECRTGREPTLHVDDHVDRAGVVVDRYLPAGTDFDDRQIRRDDARVRVEVRCRRARQTSRERSQERLLGLVRRRDVDHHSPHVRGRHPTTADNGQSQRLALTQRANPVGQTVDRRVTLPGLQQPGRDQRVVRHPQRRREPALHIGDHIQRTGVVEDRHVTIETDLGDHQIRLDDPRVRVQIRRQRTRRTLREHRQERRRRLPDRRQVQHHRADTCRRHPTATGHFQVERRTLTQRPVTSEQAVHRRRIRARVQYPSWRQRRIADAAQRSISGRRTAEQRRERDYSDQRAKSAHRHWPNVPTTHRQRINALGLTLP